MPSDFGIYDVTSRLEIQVSSSINTDGVNTARADARASLSEQARDAHTFVIGELSSSDHELSSRNAYKSGSEYYSKSDGLVHVTYKLSASALLPVLPGITTGPSTIEYPGYPSGHQRTGVDGGAQFHPTSGSYRNDSWWNPSVFEIDVPEYGKIKDIKVWVEFIHDHRGGVGPVGASSGTFFGGTETTIDNPKQGLQSVQIALRSPNVYFQYAHPQWNDRSLAGDATKVNFKFFEGNVIPDLLKSSYLLWAGHSVEPDLSGTIYHKDVKAPVNLVSGVTSIAQKVVIHKNNVITYFHTSDAAGVTALKSTYSSSYYSPVSVSTDITNVSSEMAFDVVTDSKDTLYAVYTGNDADDDAFARLEHKKVGETTWTTSYLLQNFPFHNAFDYRDLSIDVISEGNVGVLITSNNSTTTTQRMRSITYLSSGSLLGYSSPTTVFELPISSAGFLASCFTHDNEKRPIVLFSDAEVGAWKLARQIVDGTWAEEIIVTQSFSTSSLQELYCSIRCDSHGKIHAITSLPPLYMLSSSTGWSVENISGYYPTGPNSVTGSFMRLDSKDQPHTIAVLSSSETTPNCRLFYLRKNQAGWCGEWLPPIYFENSLPGRSHITPNFVLDKNDNLHIVYRGSSTTVDYLFLDNHKIQSQSYFSFDTDIDMRTIFTDSSTNSNPRHMSSLYDNSLGEQSRLYSTLPLHHGAYSSPMSGARDFAFKVIPELNQLRYKLWTQPVLDQTSFLTGGNWPWMMDNRIPMGNFVNFAGVALPHISAYGTASFGWRTGDFGEFHTSGTNLGPNDIKPVYSLLDDIYCEKVATDSQTLKNKKIVGFRPGLRGTEVHGKWQLLMATNQPPLSGDDRYNEYPDPRAGIWFRQFRLEFILEKGGVIRHAIPSSERKFKRRGIPRKTGRRNVEIISGSAHWENGTNVTYVRDIPEWGQTVGIVTSKEVDDFAVYSSLTGTFVNILSGSGRLEGIEQTFLSNEFGTPYVPLTSGSGETPSIDAFTVADQEASRAFLRNVIDPQPLLPQSDTIESHLSRNDVTKSSRTIAEEQTKK